jgi:hypothetical protein
VFSNSALNVSPFAKFVYRINGHWRTLDQETSVVKGLGRIFRELDNILKN